MRRWLLLLPLLALCAPVLAAPVGWSIITTASGQKIGQSRQDVMITATGRQIIESSAILVKEAESPVRTIAERTSRVEDKSGQTLSLTHESSARKGPLRTVAIIANGQARISRSVGSDSHVQTIPLPVGVRFDNGSGLLREWDWAAKPRLEFQNFNLSAQAVERVVIEPTVPDAQGQTVLIRRSFAGDNLRSVARLVLGANHALLATIQPLFGTSITVAPSDEAGFNIKPQPFVMSHDVLVPSRWHIPLAAAEAHMRYTLHFRDGFSFPLPHTGEQRVALNGAQAVIDICTACGSPPSPSASDLSAATRATPWMQSDHPLLQNIVKPIKARAISDAEKMKWLGLQARLKLPKIDFAGHYSALEAIQRRAGDCTEDATLLAALGRAAGIPTMVASGLVYYREDHHGLKNVFMPHSWTIAWVDGHWQSFDISLQGFDATHIALTLGEGDPRSIYAASQLAGLITWDQMAQVKARHKAE